MSQENVELVRTGLPGPDTDIIASGASRVRVPSGAWP